MFTRLLPSLAMFGIAALLIGSGLLLRRRAKEQSSWMQLPAKIVASRIEAGRGYYPYVEYEYVIDGRRIHALEVYTLQVSRFFKDSLHEVIARYPVGRSVTAYVNPRDHDKAVLEPGGDPAHVKFMSLCAILPGFAGLRLLFQAF